MKRAFAVPLTIAAGMVMSGFTTPAPDRTSSCFGSKREALVRGHFSGPLVCSEKDASFVLVGHTTERRFSIYDYRYRYLPEHGNVMHGGQKIIVFRGGEYVGQYALSPPPFATASLSGSNLVLQTDHRLERATVDLAVEPPRRVFFNGDVAIFYR